MKRSCLKLNLKASSVFEVQSTDSGSPVLKPSAKTSKVSSLSTNICQKEGANRFEPEFHIKYWFAFKYSFETSFGIHKINLNIAFFLYF